jgi:prolyl-tRNA editing enzyme YbaK/EbsC (Cys-tRNA(Pro) deacylase)
VGHPSRLRTLVDEDLLSLAEVWAAAGTPNAVFRLTPAQLARLTQADVMRVRALTDCEKLDQRLR